METTTVESSGRAPGPRAARAKSVSAPSLTVTIDGAAAMIDVSGRTVGRWVAAGRMPRPRKVGGVVRFDRAEIEAWIEAGLPDRATWEAMRATPPATEPAHPVE